MVWALSTLYGSPAGNHLVFKGGTSLSKVYKIIKRFSEDVDLTWDIRAIMLEWVINTTRPIVAAALAAESLLATLRGEGEQLFIDYEAVAAWSGYVTPSVMLEFGARSTGEPASYHAIGCDAADIVQGVAFPTARSRIMHAERTFWAAAALSRRQVRRKPAGGSRRGFRRPPRPWGNSTAGYRCWPPACSRPGWPRAGQGRTDRPKGMRVSFERTADDE